MISDSILVQDWIKNSQKYLNARYSVFDSIWCGLKLRYLIFRTKYMLLRTFLLTVFHFFEVILLLGAYTHKIISCILIIKIISTIFISFWWGYTEVLRERIRKLNKIHAIEEIIRQRSIWVFWGGILGLVFCVVLTVVGMLLSRHMLHYNSHTLKFYNFYLAILVCEFFIAFYLKTIHESVYAVRRVFWPMWAILLPVIINIILMLVLFKLIGLNAILISNTAASVIGVFLSYKYIYNTLGQLNQSYKIYPLDYLRGSFRQILSLEGFLAGVSNIFIQSGYALLIVICFVWFKNHPHTLYVLLVLLQTCYSLPHILYFDLKKFNNDWEYKLFVPTIAFALKFIIGLSILLWLVSLGVSYYFHFDLKLVIFIFCIFIFRGILSFHQIMSFVRHKYLQLIIEGVIFISVGITLITFSKVNILSGLLLLILAFIIGILVIRLNKDFLIVKDTLIKDDPFSTWVEFYQDLILRTDSRVLVKINFMPKTNFYKIARIAADIKNNIADCKILKNDTYSLWILCTNFSFLQKIIPEVVIAASGNITDFNIINNHKELIDILEPRFHFEIAGSDIFLSANPDGLQYLKYSKQVNTQHIRQYCKSIHYKLKESLYQVYINHIIELDGVKYSLNPMISKNSYLVQGVLLCRSINQLEAR